MRKFKVTALKFKPDDIFCMGKPTDEVLRFYCNGLTDLYRTLRVITPQGYRIPQKETLSKRIKGWHPQPLISYSIFRQPMAEIIEIKEVPEIQTALDYTNSFGFTHKLKVIK